MNASTNNCTQPAAAPYDAIFFDMDGTLLPLEVRDFLGPYYELLAVAATRAGFDTERVQDAVNRGIFVMYDHPTTETNAEAFWRTFYQHYFGTVDPAQRDKERLHAFIDDFYKRDFGKAGEGTVPNPAAAHAIETLVAKGYPLYLTTMPMFPYEAIAWRMKWAQAPIEPFARVTTFNNSTSVKPHLAYYQENLALADVPPERVLMVGNNTMDDMACLHCGMDAYLVTDYLINQNEFEVSSVKHGSLADFDQWVQDLPECHATHALSWRERADELRMD